MSDNFFFIGLPYAAFFVMIIGSIFRYKNLGFKVSSLSTQFLEGRELFYGSRPFHWGIIFLFFGHLVAFLFPKSLVLWNSVPLRLLIIEVAAFGFGLLTLFGLTILVFRRYKNKRIYMITSKMDAFVYIILLVQVITGLLVAYTARWGSAWFPTVLTPYLRSLFVLNPDISAVSALPLLVKIHIISAYVLIGMIPFTRFVHFLVYPFGYFFRRYQYVIWNWDRKKIRASRKLVNGVRSKNN